MKEKKPISLLLLIFAMTLFGSYYVYHYCVDKINKELVNTSLEEISNEEISINSSIKPISVKETYLGILEIPKIKLTKGFYNVDSVNNDVNKNVQLLKESVMPDNDNSMVFLAAHSGNSYLGYFKNIDKLVMDDEIFLYYKNKKYTYSIMQIMEQEKNGTIMVKKNAHEKILVLTTCSKKSEKQLVIKARLIKEIVNHKS